jgi:RNA polymerase sigma-70 factor (ECF subfamily)
MLDEASERSLIDRSLGGDSSAFGSLIEEYQKALFNTAYRMLGDPEDARDVTQTAFVKSFEKLATYDPRYRFFSWIYRILVNEALNCLDRRRSQEPIALDLVAPGRMPDEELERNDRHERIQSAVCALAPDHRLVIVLRYFGGMSYREMSEVLEIPDKTVKSRLYSARRILLGILVRQGVRA